MPARGDLLFMLKDAKPEILHFSVNTKQVPCCTTSVLTSLYFGKNTVSIAKTCNLPLTQSFGAQLVCLDAHCLFSRHSLLLHTALPTIAPSASKPSTPSR